MSISSSSRIERAAKATQTQKARVAEYRIGDVTRLTGLSADTLRYYEKIDLLPPITRTASGIRVYTDKDISRLGFIRRAQKMNFSLAEIASLIRMREDPQRARKSVRELTHRKLEDVDSHMAELDTLRKELALLINLCHGAEAGCPIIENLDSNSKPKKPKRR